MSLEYQSHVRTMKEIKDAVGEVAARYGVARVLLFGSYAQGTAMPESDIDLRIDKGRLRGLLQLSGFRIDLEERLRAKVDVLTTESLDDSFLSNIKNQEVLLYEHV